MVSLLWILVISMVAGVFRFVSATFTPSIVNTNELCFVQCTPAAYVFAKSTPSIKCLLKFWHTKKFCLHVSFPIFSSHSILPIAPKLVPSAPTTWGTFDLSRSFSWRFKILNVAADMTLLVAPVSKSVLNVLSLTWISNIVPFFCPKLSSILKTSSFSGQPGEVVIWIVTFG